MDSQEGYVKDISYPSLLVTVDLLFLPVPGPEVSRTQELISHLVQTHDTA